MRRKHCALRWCALVLAVLLAWTGLLLDTAQAEEGEENSLTLLVACEDTRIGQMPFRLYRVAESQGGTLVPVEELAEAPVSFQLNTSQEMQACATTLDAYLVSQREEGNPIDPLAEGETDESGQLTFSNLPDGVYLLVGEQTEQEGLTYTPSPALLLLPQSETDGTHQRAVLVEPKIEPSATYDVNQNSMKETLTVEKHWENGSAQDRQPQEVTVALYGDGAEYDRVTLSQENNWQYTWQNLAEEVHWQVMELDVPEGYTVTVEQEGQTLVLTNTWNQAETTPEESAPTSEPPAATTSEEPTTGSTPAGTTSEEPTTGSTPTAATSETPTETAAEKLPQTGQLWWPVPLFGAVGLCLFLLGVGVWRKHS